MSTRSKVVVVNVKSFVGSGRQVGHSRACPCWRDPASLPFIAARTKFVAAAVKVHSAS